MIISNNRAQFANQTDANTGLLRTYGNSALGANDAFLGFKPASVFKSSGFLSVSGTGSFPRGMPLTIYMEFRRPGINLYFHVVVLNSTVTTGSGSKSFFSFQVDIPVGIISHSELNNAIVTRHLDETTSMAEWGAYITADPDDVYIAQFKYETSYESITPGSVKIISVISEYKEN